MKIFALLIASIIAVATGHLLQEEVEDFNTNDVKIGTGIC